jgi:iron complex transport system ATP-binding protein
VGELSGGERQRVILARAFAQTPRILLLDEPTTFLDIRHQADVARVLKRWAGASGGMVVAVFHDLNLAARICSHVVLLKDGKPIASGPLKETLSTDTIQGAFDVAMEERPQFTPV